MAFQQPVQPRGLGPQVQQVLESIVTVVRQVLRVPLLDGRLIKGVTFDGGSSTFVKHGLGRRPLGWIAVSITYGLVINEVTQDSRSDKQLELYSDAAGSADIWVF